MRATAPTPQRSPLLLSIRVRAVVDAVPAARRALRTALESNVPGTVVDTAELLLSELMTNAVRHAPSGHLVSVAAEHCADVVRVVVVDGGGALPQRAHPVAPLDENGRGLVLVEALAREWGSYPVPEGKAVWCDVALRDQPAFEPDGVR